MTTSDVTDVNATSPDERHIAEGTYNVGVGKAADALELTAETTLTEAHFGS